MKLKFKYISAALAVILTAGSVPCSSKPWTAQAADFRVCINEICTQNKSCLADSYGEYSDWIELYNFGISSVDMSGFGLSDNEDDPLKWVFPDGTTISAGEHKIIFASLNSSTASELHTGFGLSKKGETIVFSDPEGTIIQKIKVPALGEDASYGRSQDAGKVFEVMGATPGSANEEIISAPDFSADSGFYDDDFLLTLTAGAHDTIYYTTDSSDPTTSPTAQVYKQAITVCDMTSHPNVYSAYDEDIDSPQSVSTAEYYKKPGYCVDKASVVRAAARSSDGKFSTVSDRTFFVSSGSLSKYKNLMVVSLVTDPDNIFGPDNGIYVTGNRLIDWRNKYLYNPHENSGEGRELANFSAKGREWERETNVTIFENGTSVARQNMGIRIKGNSTRNWPQKSFSLFARSEYGATKIKFPLIDKNYSFDSELIDRYDSICLRAVSDKDRVRDGFAQKLLSDREDIATLDMNKCVVFLDGEYWGLYEMTEKLSDDFIESNYGVKKDNVAIIKNQDSEEGDPDEYYSFNNFAKIYSTKDMTDPENYKAVCEYIDPDSLIEHYAAGLYLNTLDWPNFNYGIWRNTGECIEGNPYSDGRWRFVSFDFDLTMGSQTWFYSDYTDNNFGCLDTYGGNAPTNIFVSLLKNEEFRNKFVSVYCDYANEVMSPSKADAVASDYVADYKDLIADTTLRWEGWDNETTKDELEYQGENFCHMIDDIRDYFNNRAEYTLEHMKAYLCLKGELQTITLNTKGNGTIKINSVVPDISEGGWKGLYYSDCPVTLTVIPDDGAEFSGWEGDITGTDKTVTLTLSDAMNVQADFTQKSEVSGDVNADSEFDAADIVMLQSFLISAGDITDWQAGDFNDNGRPAQLISVF
ncbi:MAG: CotH kinase family protein [Oscillospiraceae bacterium]|nr:CotH kinase family protein [Oscillospiraceae bacterium]